jgi:hypothetical protein
MVMRRVRAAIVLLTALLTALTAIGMAMMPVLMPSAGVHAEAAMHASDQGDGRPHGGGQHHGSDDCLYCQLAKATDLPARHEPVMVHRRLMPCSAGLVTPSCQPRAWTMPHQPRAPPPALS